MSEQVAAGLLVWLADAAVSCGVARAALWEACGLDADALQDPSASVPLPVFEAALRCLLVHTGDRGLGLRLARPVDLRTQGFWGYALLASTTLRERIELHIRYRHLRFPAEMSLTVEGERASVTWRPRGIAPDVLPILLDWGIATTCHQQRRHFGDDADLALWLSYPEAPHHAALRALVAGPVTFDAAVDCMQFPARHLDQSLVTSDPHLYALACAQLDADSARMPAARPASLRSQVQASLESRLAYDASLEGVARDLGISARTLRRRLGALGVSFQALLLEVRRTRALALLKTDAAIDGVGMQLGYGDPANFRRAFRRWTGVAPSAYRAAQRVRAAEAED
ncbi:MAG: AraC family transcriptional regulator ligand-binding domain-containing protein [Polyangiales bacterium]